MLQPGRSETVFTYGAPQLKFGDGSSDEIGFDLSTYLDDAERWEEFSRNTKFALAAASGRMWNSASNSALHTSWTR